MCSGLAHNPTSTAMKLFHLFGAACSLVLTASAQVPQNWIIGPGQDVVYNTAKGPVFIKRLEIQSGGRLRIVGPLRFELTATREISIAGTLDLSGGDSLGVTTLNTANHPEFGSRGSAGGGNGGVGSSQTTASTASGGDGVATGVATGGSGGESGFLGVGPAADRRAAGGGGGAYGPPILNSNEVGARAENGCDGAATAFGALTSVLIPAGGLAGTGAFVDADPRNDFFGRKLTPNGLVIGELITTQAGTGGGAGGDAVPSATFPSNPFTPSSDEKGAGGGGGGGLGILLSRRIKLLPGGLILSNGGIGGGGENTNFFDRIGGGSGGGSGGQLILQASLFDFSAAEPNAIRAIGGAGGVGAGNSHTALIGCGGDGGPGVVQIHTMNGTESAVLLPPGMTLGDLTIPNAHVLLPEPNF